MGFCGMNFFSTGGIMVIAVYAVNGLAPEILFFVKKMDAKQFARGILRGELEERRGLRWSPIEHAPEPVFRRWNGEDRS